MSVLNLSGQRELPMIRQAEAAECGLACIAMIASYHGYEIDLASMRRRFSLSMKGMTLRTMIDVGAALNLSGRPIRCEPSELRDLILPAVLHWGTNHFVILRAIKGRRFLLHDPAHGQRSLLASELSAQFTGVALELTPNLNFERVKQKNPLKLESLFSLRHGVGRALIQTVLLSVVIEVLTLTIPFYLQFVIDDVLLKGDQDLLRVLALAFVLLLFFRLVSSSLRGLTTQFISNVLSFDMKGRVFRHLVRLPLDWFQKRQIGDVQSRFWAVRGIQSFVAQGAVAGIIDGGLGVLVLMLMFFYSPVLASIVLVSIGFIVFVRVGTFQVTRRFAADCLVTDAREQTKFLETLRAAETIKASGSENIRETQYRNAAANSINAQIRSGNITIGSGIAEQAVNGAADILVIYVGAQAVMRGAITLGMLTAFLAYKSQFVTRFSNLITQLFSWRLLDLQLERLADIVMSPKEARIDGGGYVGTVEGAIECRAVGFRYSFGDPAVLSALSFTIAPGECVAIVGPSGCGKSTLAKLLVGLYPPTSGEVFIDSKQISYWSNNSLRTQISYVSQDDQLLAGSLAENIGFFSEQIDMERVRECARAACIEGEILAMPMGYESLVGDMGSSLSGGQKQRVLIARALYRRPRILVLDEATAHLDVNTERAVANALAHLTITRIVIAHRPETVAAADRVLTLGTWRTEPLGHAHGGASDPRLRPNWQEERRDDRPSM